MAFRALFSSITVLVTSVLFSTSLFADLDYFVESVVKDPAKYQQEIGKWVATEDVKALGFKTSLMAVIANGKNPASHVVVLQFPDYKGIDRMQKVNATSRHWSKFQRSLAAIRERHTEGLASEIANYGKKGWQEGDVIAVVALRVRDQASYAEAFDEMMSSELAKKAPGMLRLVRHLGGGRVTHFVLISGPSFAAVNDYLDITWASSEFATFQEKVGTSRKRLGVDYLQVTKTWN